MKGNGVRCFLDDFVTKNQASEGGPQQSQKFRYSSIFLPFTVITIQSLTTVSGGFAAAPIQFRCTLYPG